MLEKSILLQDKILNYISREIRIKGYPPTIREIADEMQIKSASTVHMHLRSLEKRGLIRRNPSKPRAIELVSSSEFSEYVKTHPVVWEQKSISSDANESSQCYLELPEYLCGYDRHFLYTVENLALYSHGILPGDVLVIHQQNEIDREGFFLVKESDQTLPLYYKQHNKDWLFSDDMHSILPEQCDVLGKVLSLLRKYPNI